MNSPTGDSATADMVVEGITAFIMGNLNPNCYSDSNEELSGFQVATRQILPTWILICGQSTLKLFKDAELLTEIKTVGNQANVYT